MLNLVVSKETARLGKVNVFSPNSAICHNIKTANKVFENMSEFKFVSTKLTNENGVNKEIRSGIIP
jgi:hypothetical protein